MFKLYLVINNLLLEKKKNFSIKYNLQSNK